MEADHRFDAQFRKVTGWHPDGSLESSTWIPRPVRGRVRATIEAAPFAALPRPDVIWTSVTEVLGPYLWAQAGPMRRPLVLDLDSTWSQLDAMAPVYKGRTPREGVHRRQALLRERALFSRVTLFTPWSRWAANGLRSRGIPDDRIRVIPPGVDLGQWPKAQVPEPGPRLRLLFVGGNFIRKGGDMLIDLMRTPLGEELELDIVTRDPVEPAPNTRVHRLEQGAPALSGLYRRADLFVMPSRGECFGVATVEAMASSRPVLVSNVGAAAEIVDHGHTGWLIPPEASDLAAALRNAVAHRGQLQDMGRHARAIAEQRFDANVNFENLASILCSSWEASRVEGI